MAISEKLTTYIY